MFSELASAIDDLKSKIPSKPRNGELTTIRLHLKSVCEGQDEIKEAVSMIKKKLLNPENGVVVRVNKNKGDIEELIGYTKGFLKKCEGMEIDVKECKKFKNGAHKALWVIYTAIMGLAAKLIFFND